MDDKKNSNTRSDDFDLDFSKKREPRVSEPISRPEEVHIPIRSSSPSRRPNNKKKKKYKPPKETILIYTIMAAAILMIVTVVFIISLNSLKDTESGTTDEDSSSLSAYLISGGSAGNSSEDSDDSSDSGDSESKSEIVVPANYDYDYFDNDLFIGDSIFTGLYTYEGILDADNVAAEIGFTPYRAHYNDLGGGKGTAVDYAKSIKPKHINIMLGTNAFGLNIPYTELIDDYKGLINALKEASPNSKICVISIPPVTKDSSLAEGAEITNDKINTVNKYIENMCTEMNIKYFDLNTHLSDDDGYFKEEYAELDGMHFKVNTYDVLLYGLEQMWNKSGERGTL